MTRNLVVAGVSACLIALLAVPAAAQSGDATRPGGSTFLGDTGLWFVPTAEILASGSVAASGQLVNLNREQGFSAIQHVAGTFAVGVGGRVEVFGSVRFLTRIDRDLRPLFGAGLSTATMRRHGGVLNAYPTVRQAFSGNQFGDAAVGVKINLLSEERQAPVAFALRGFVELPTGDELTGTTSGQVDGEVDLVVSKAAGNVEIAGFGGFAFRSDPAGIDVANSIAWGFGLGAPLRGPVQVFGEVGGEAYLSDMVTLSEPLLAMDGSMSPLITTLRSPLDVTVGLRWNGPSGFSVGGGLNWATRHSDRSRVRQASAMQDELGCWSASGTTRASACTCRRRRHRRHRRRTGPRPSRSPATRASSGSARRARCAPTRRIPTATRSTTAGAHRRASCSRRRTSRRSAGGRPRRRVRCR